MMKNLFVTIELSVKLNRKRLSYKLKIYRELLS